MPDRSGVAGFSGSVGAFGPGGRAGSGGPAGPEAPQTPQTTVALRPVAPADLPLLVQETSGFDYFGPRTTRTEPHAGSLFGTGGMGVWAGESLVGCVTWLWLQRGPTDASRNPMIGIWIRSEERRRGYGTRAQHLIVEEFFRHTAVHRVEAATEVANLAEQRALEKAGFSREGVLRKSLWRDGSFRDVYVYSVLREEWGSPATAT